jgi:hypothetical protein
MTAATRIPGSAIGSVTLRNTRILPAPASRAASSSERGTALNAAAGIHVMKTTVPITCTMTMPSVVSMRFSP